MGTAFLTGQGGRSLQSLTADATAAASDILNSKTAYVNGVKITGTQSLANLTADATAAVGEIVTGKTAYVNGSKLTGTLVPIADLGLTAGSDVANGVISSGWHQVTLVAGFMYAVFVYILGAASPPAFVVEPSIMRLTIYPASGNSTYYRVSRVAIGGTKTIVAGNFGPLSGAGNSRFIIF